MKLSGNSRLPAVAAAALAAVLAAPSAWAAASRRALKAGYRGVQVHCCHGYLLGQFLSPLTNLRRDGYGGSIKNRARFLLEVVEAVRPALGNEGILSVRLGLSDSLPKDPPEGLSLEDGLWVARELGKMGIDHLDISGNLCGYDAPGEGYFGDWARAAKEVRTSTDYTLAGRRSGTVEVSGVLLGALVGGASTVGTVEMAYRFGLSAWWFTLGGGLG